MAEYFDIGIFSVEDTGGAVGVGWKLNFYLTGTSTPRNTYPTLADAEAQTNPNTNPVISDAAGRFPPIWLIDGDYKVIMTDDVDVVKVTRDPAVYSSAGDYSAPGGSDLIGFIQAGAGAVPRTVQDKLREIVSLADFGAEGDGVADDTADIQAALDSGAAKVVGVPGAVYHITDRLIISSNTWFDLNGAKIVRKWQNDWVLGNSTAATTHNNENIRLDNMWFEDDGTAASRGNFLLMTGVNGLVINNYKVRASAPVTGGLGAWCAFISGEDIIIDGWDIDTSACGLYSDGIHFGYAKRVSMANFKIFTGDDGIALHHTPAIWPETQAGMSEGISIRDGYIESVESNGIRVGSWGEGLAPGEPAYPENSWKNVGFSGVTFGPCGTACIQLQDDRMGAEIDFVNDNITFGDMNFGDQANLRIIAVEGNDDLTDPANINQKNWNRVTINDASGRQGTGGEQLIRAGGVTELKMADINLTHNYSGGSATSSALEMRQVGVLDITDSSFNSDTTSPTLSLVLSNRMILSNVNIVGSNVTSEVMIFLNALVTPQISIFGGSITNTTVCINKSGTGTLSSFIVYGVALSASVSRNTIVDADVTGTYVFSPVDAPQLPGWTANADAPVNGYIAVTDPTGAVRKLATIA